MTVNFLPSFASGSLAAPPSKSLTHRYLICAALAGGESEVHEPASGEDIDATIRFLEASENVLDCGESGSTLRFVLPICLLSGEEYRFTGSGRLLERPLQVYETICREQGLLFQNNGKTLRVRGPLRPGAFEIPGNISSQFVSGLLFALPLMDGPSTLRVLPPVESSSYIYLTLHALQHFGITAEHKCCSDGSLLLSVPGSQKYRPADVTVEGDYSAAAVFEAFNCLGGNVHVTGLDPDSLQGDRIYREFFDELCGGTPDLDVSDCPDLAPVLFVLAELLHGARFTGTGKLRFKESDRLAAMEEELEKYRAWRESYAAQGDSAPVPAPLVPSGRNGYYISPPPLVPSGRNGYYISPPPLVPSGRNGHRISPAPLVLSSHNDHRIAMALSLLLSRTGGSLTGAECVKKSLPGFFDELRRLGIQISVLP